MSQELTQYQKLVECLKHHLRFVWSDLEPNDEEQNDEEYFQNTFINNAVNNEIKYDFYEMWNNTANDYYFEMSAETLLRILNEVKDWYRNEMGDDWLPPNNEYSIETIMNGWAEANVREWGVDAVREIINAAIEEEEEYTGTKDFPPNETDDNCPICLETYTSRKMRDGIRNSEYKVKCPHYCCCDCWLELYEKNEGEKKRCPICRANVTDWLESVIPSYQPDYP